MFSSRHPSHRPIFLHPDLKSLEAEDGADRSPFQTGTQVNQQARNIKGMKFAFLFRFLKSFLKKKKKSKIWCPWNETEPTKAAETWTTVQLPPAEDDLAEGSHGWGRTSSPQEQLGSCCSGQRSGHAIGLLKASSYSSKDAKAAHILPHSLLLPSVSLLSTTPWVNITFKACASFWLTCHRSHASVLSK